MTNDAGGDLLRQEGADLSSVVECHTKMCAPNSPWVEGQACEFVDGQSDDTIESNPRDEGDEGDAGCEQQPVKGEGTREHSPRVTLTPPQQRVRHCTSV